MISFAVRRSGGVFVLLLLLSLNALAQYHAQRPNVLKANSRWFFGEYGLNLNQQPAQVVQTPAFLSMYTSRYLEPFVNNAIGTRYSNVVPVSDRVTGDLRFVATLSLLSDRNFAPMPNGDFGDLTFPQDNFEKCIAVVPVINNDRRYYYYALSTAADDSLVLMQSVVDMDLNNGLGDVPPSEKNIPVIKLAGLNTITDVIDVVPGNNCDLWLLLAENKVNIEAHFNILAFHITSAGIDPVPVVSGFEKNDAYEQQWDYQVSPDRRLLSYVSYYKVNTVRFLNFNAENGMVSGSIYPDIPLVAPRVDLVGSRATYDVHTTFTPDNNYFFVYNGVLRDHKAVFYKYDLTAYDNNYRVDSFSYPMPSYVAFDPISLTFYIPAAIFFKPYDNKLYSNIPQSWIISLPPTGDLAVRANSTVKLFSYGPATSTGSWRNFSFDPEMNLSAKCRLFTNSSVNYAYNAGDTIPTVYDSVLCMLPGDAFPPIDISAKDGFTGYRWNDGTTGRSIQVTKPGKYWVFYRGPCNDRVDTFTFRLWFPSKVLPPDTLVCEQRLPITIKPIAEGDFYWKDINSFTPERQIDAPGVYTVQFKDFGCTQEDSVRVSTKFCPCGVGMPNAFTPNGDGLNDYFKPVITPGCVPAGYSFRIFNRWGQVVYSSFNEFDKGWDGRGGGGNPADVGTYFYEVRFKSRFLSDAYVTKGELTLIR